MSLATPGNDSPWGEPPPPPRWNLTASIIITLLNAIGDWYHVTTARLSRPEIQTKRQQFITFITSRGEGGHKGVSLLSLLSREIYLDWT